MVKPIGVTIRAYDVGFGDCFLVIFHYKHENRCLLIDFGSTGLREGADKKRMKAVAADIQNYVSKNCKGQLHGVVATHRHKDHISGFAGDTGAILEALKPRIVIQPWTEEPGLQRNAKAAVASVGGSPGKSLAAMTGDYLMALDNMHAFSKSTLEAVHEGMGVTNARKIRFLADDNLANREAVERLARMGDNTIAEYVNAGFKTKLSKLLPGVTVHVLGPPTLKQTETILKQRARNTEEFWHFMQFWALLPLQPGATEGGVRKRLFPQAEVLDELPMHTRWFVDRANRLNGNQLLGIVRILDKAMNNTSVILLLEVGKRKLLFPGDAQIENWAFALNDPKAMKLLTDVDVYKVGHHGSLNATPKTLWKQFTRRSKKKSAPGRLISVVSTMHGKHGEPPNTEVPRRPLMEALGAESHLHSTEDLDSPEFYEDIPCL
jgi:hypothetical protein